MRSLYYRMHFRRAAHRADVIMVDSEFTRREAIRLLGVKSSRIRRVYLSSECIEEDPAGFREYFGLRGRYVVYAGTVEPRKNVSGLLKAWSFVLDKHPDCTLVIAGRWGWGTSELKKAISTSSGVFWTGEIPRILLNSCITGAELLVYPSFYEGFGLPPLEAASAGTPSVVSPADALVEIYSDISRVAADQGGGPGCRRRNGTPANGRTGLQYHNNTLHLQDTVKPHLPGIYPCPEREACGYRSLSCAASFRCSILANDWTKITVYRYIS
jgi:glycosyltransferase involved in cell wall biosynthesis